MHSKIITCNPFHKPQYSARFHSNWKISFKTYSKNANNALKNRVWFINKSIIVEESDRGNTRTESNKKCEQISDSCSYITMHTLWHCSVVDVHFKRSVIPIEKKANGSNKTARRWWRKKSHTLLCSLQWIWNFDIFVLTAEPKNRFTEYVLDIRLCVCWLLWQTQSQIMCSWNICKKRRERLNYSGGDVGGVCCYQKNWRWRWWC